MRPETKKLILRIAAVGASLWLCIAVVDALRTSPLLGYVPPKATTHTRFLDDAKAGLVRSATVGPQGTQAVYKDGTQLTVNAVQDPYFVSDLLKAGVDVAGIGSSDSTGSSAWQALLSFGPVALLAGVFLFMSKGGRGAGGPMSFGVSRAKMRSGEETDQVTFADVAGCDEAKEEVKELVDFLRDPAKFQKLGGRIPCGVLLSGGPGTGKTLLARAIAGEAKVPFFTLSGSDFVEMFVGVGAARVRDLFVKAKAAAPCIIFIDEIDAVGRRRGTGHGNGNDEREQTLNQMLVEMDGFEKGAGIIVIAATNRPDVLDPALTRPGRFDRQVDVGLPDVRGREQILNVHLRKVPSGEDVKVAVLARGTTGFSGADLANLVNEAALFAARRSAVRVAMDDFEQAKDKITMGSERKSVVMSDEERRNTAYHEAGHAVLAELLPKADRVHKVTIVPRGRALGLTLQLPDGDRYSTDKTRLESMLTILYGGRIAEILFVGEATTGASNDFERATSIARNMVTRWGYSEVLGPMVLAANETDPQAAQFVSPDTLREVDQEIRDVLRARYAQAELLLTEHAGKVHAMANALLEWETLDADQVQDAMASRPVQPPKATTNVITVPAAQAPAMAPGLGEAVAA